MLADRGYGGGGNDCGLLPALLRTVTCKFVMSIKKIHQLLTDI